MHRSWRIAMLFEIAEIGAVEIDELRRPFSSVASLNLNSCRDPAFHLVWIGVLGGKDFRDKRESSPSGCWGDLL